MELKFVAQKKPVVVSAVVQRRQKLLGRIDQQIELLRSPTAAALPRSLWAWMDEAGSYFLPVKYGRHPLELKKGMFAIQCADIAECEAALTAVRAMVLHGDFDDQLSKVSADIRKRFTA